ncbi:hypothetical protein DFH06DRAFT_1124264 [Mycena polygramma]|nr:hypothetical protein DFH06DRAFT_1124264 [Mycena polygramma]
MSSSSWQGSRPRNVSHTAKSPDEKNSESGTRVSGYLTGGTGGPGGESANTGGDGGHGEGPRIDADDLSLFAQITGGTGGVGGAGPVKGGTGGTGHAPTFAKAPLSIFPSDRNFKRVQPLTVVQFCKTYHLSDTIRDLLHEEGFETAWALFEVPAAALKRAGFKSGHIAELQWALNQLKQTKQ